MHYGVVVPPELPPDCDEPPEEPPEELPPDCDEPPVLELLLLVPLLSEGVVEDALPVLSLFDASFEEALSVLLF